LWHICDDGGGGSSSSSSNSSSIARYAGRPFKREIDTWVEVERPGREKGMKGMKRVSVCERGEERARNSIHTHYRPKSALAAAVTLYGIPNRFRFVSPCCYYYYYY